MSSVNVDFVHKLVILGDSGVGKTSLVERYVYDSLSPDMAQTIGAVLHVKALDLEGRLHKLVIWDLGGGESFAELREQYCANASGAFFVVDRTRPETLDSIGVWLEALYTAAGKVPVVLVENKMDLEPKIPAERILKVTKTRSLGFIQTSATENSNVDQAFRDLVCSIGKTGKDPTPSKPRTRR
jgi:small GTP-binding protein